MLIFRTSCIEFRLEFALENLLEQVREPAIIGFQNRILGGKIQRPFAIQRVIHRCAGEIANRLVQIVHRHCNARGGELEHFLVNSIAVLALKHQAQLTRSGHEKIGSAILIAKGMAADYNRISPRSEEHTSELQSLMRISYAVFFLKKKT